MSAITARTNLHIPKLSNVWRHPTLGTIQSIVDLGDHDAHLTFDSAADARAVAAECIKAAEAMERIEVEGPVPSVSGTEEG